MPAGPAESCSSRLARPTGPDGCDPTRRRTTGGPSVPHAHRSVGAEVLVDRGTPPREGSDRREPRLHLDRSQGLSPGPDDEEQDVEHDASGADCSVRGGLRGVHGRSKARGGTKPPRLRVKSAAPSARALARVRERPSTARNGPAPSRLSHAADKARLSGSVGVAGVTAASELAHAVRCSGAEGEAVLCRDPKGALTHP
jgi:hypothetical protein